MMHKGNYKKLVRFLQTNGYTVEVEKCNSYWGLPKSPYYNAYYVSGKGIVACFCTPNKYTHRSLNGKLAADNAECFDKWSKCPLIMNISEIDYNVLLSQLELLGSKEGFDLSNNFEYDKFVHEL